MSIATDVELSHQVIRRLFWRLLPFLFLLYIVSYLDRINVGRTGLGRFVISPRLIVRRSSSRHPARQETVVDSALRAFS